MNLLALFTTVVVYLLLNQPQTPSAAERMMPLERRAVADTQLALASDLDSELPKVSFVGWFEKIVGPGAGIVWQLSECGEAEANDLRACVEANAVLPDGRQVIVMVAVGTFKRRMTGARTWIAGVLSGHPSYTWETHPTWEEGYLLEGEYCLAECIDGKSKVGIYTSGSYFFRPAGEPHVGPDAGAKGYAIWLFRTPAELDVKYLDETACR
jgi:hypothetical protein